jgi:hypothetical protein
MFTGKATSHLIEIIEHDLNLFVRAEFLQIGSRLSNGYTENLIPILFGKITSF